MVRLFITLLFCLPAALSAAPAARESAFTALTALPIDELSRLAKVAACDGTPAPERWHFLVFAPGTENGYREYVVVNHQIAVRREFSQFAEMVTVEDVIGTDGVKVDSQRLGELAMQYAKANRVSVATCNYELSREGPGLAPRWKVDCLDKSGKTVGSIVVNAAQGVVVSREGFKKDPTEATSSRSTRADVPARRRPAQPQLATRPSPPRGQTGVPTDPSLEPIAAAPEQPLRSPQVRRAERVPPEPQGPLTRIVRGIFNDDD